jgi:hypothetical protein
MIRIGRNVLKKTRSPARNFDPVPELRLAALISTGH